MIDDRMKLADAQPFTGSATGTGYGLTEHSFDVGDARDWVNGHDCITAVITITAQPSTTNLDDTFQFEILTAETALTQATGAVAEGTIQSLTKLGTSSRFLAADLTKGTQIELKLSPITAKRLGGLVKPEGNGVAAARHVFGWFNCRTVGLALIAPITGGSFDIEIRTERVRGQKYYPQGRNVG